MKLLKRSLIVLFTLAFAVSITACGKKLGKPDSSVSSFFDALKKADIKTASKFVESGKLDEDFKFDDAQQEKIVKLIYSNLNYEILSSNVDKDTATVKVKLTSPDLKDIMEKVISEVMQAALATSTTGTAPNQADLEKMMMDKLTAAVNDPSAKKITKEYELALVPNSEKKAWALKDNETLENAVKMVVDGLDDIK